MIETTDKITLKLGDCLELMKDLPDKSIDMVLCDLPYSVLNKKNKASEWDKPIPLEPLWEQYKRVCKDNAAIVLFAQGMFTAKLMMSNPDMWRYNLVWKKGNRVSGFLNANRMPMRNHEDICIFYKKQPVYNPQMEKGQKTHSKGHGPHKETNNCYGTVKDLPSNESDMKYPKSVLNFERDYGQFYHPTQKPVNLLRWLIRTYTLGEGVVLDNAIGSGSTGVAAAMEDRKFIGMELNPEYYAIAENRINEANLK
jgi:DNA modification methylase